MANPVFVSGAAAIKQTYTITIANTWAQGDTITLTIDNITFVVTIGTLVTTAQVATTLKQAYNAETLTDTAASYDVTGGAVALGAFAEMVATVSSSVVTLTAVTAGKPFTMTTGDVANTAGNGTATVATGIANAGPYEADNVDNWDINAVPVDNDAVYFDGSGHVLYDLTLAVQPLTVNKPKKYIGRVGLPAINRDAPNKPYREYRGRYLLSDDNTVTTTLNLETGDGPGSDRFMYDNGAGQAIVNVFGRGPRETVGVPSILWKGSHASNVINNLAGDLGVAFYGAETAVVATLRSGPATSASTICGAGVSLTTVLMEGGYLLTNSAITAATQYAGTYEHTLGTITTLSVLGGAFYPLGGATITTLNVGSGGTFDCRKGAAAFTITNTVQLYKGSTFLDPNGRTGNVVFKLNQCTLADVTVILPHNKTFTPS